MEHKIVNISHNTSPAILCQRDLEINNCDNLIHTLSLQVHFIFKMSFEENFVTTDTEAQRTRTAEARRRALHAAGIETPRFSTSHYKVLRSRQNKKLR